MYIHLEFDDVRMSKHAGEEDVQLAVVTALVSSGEDLHGDELAAPLRFEHLPETTLSDGFQQLHLNQGG
jgi:hypothetical protein